MGQSILTKQTSNNISKTNLFLNDYLNQNLIYPFSWLQNCSLSKSASEYRFPPFNYFVKKHKGVWDYKVIHSRVVSSNRLLVTKCTVLKQQKRVLKRDISKTIYDEWGLGGMWDLKSVQINAAISGNLAWLSSVWQITSFIWRKTSLFDVCNLPSSQNKEEGCLTSCSYRKTK